MKPLARLPIPPILASSARSMAPSYLRRRLARLNTPYVDGETVTFTYVGEAEAVRVMHFMGLFPPIPELERLDGTELWFCTVRLPKGCRVEYQLEVAREGRIDRISDPLNRRSASDPFGSNSVAYGPGYSVPPWAVTNPQVEPGRVEVLEVASAAFGSSRTVTVYLPAGASQSPLPSVYLHDGSDLIEYADATTVFDNLIAAGTVQPFAAVLLDPVDRNYEYTGLEEHAVFVTREVPPAVAAAFPEVGTPAVIGGASLGAIAAFSTAWRFPGTYPAAVLMSGSFVTALGGRWNRGPVFGPVVSFMSQFADEPRRAVDDIWMSCGEYEMLAADNQRFVTQLRNTGIDVTYSETADGHHWQNWRDMLGRALPAVLPAQQ